MKTPAQTLRELIEAPQILTMPGVFDGFSGRLVAIRLKAGFITGSGVGTSLTSDGTRRESAACRAIVALPLPLIAWHTGYGNAVNVCGARSAGGRGRLMFEDQIWPSDAATKAGDHLGQRKRFAAAERGAIGVRSRHARTPRMASTKRSA
jgi:2-methylisocitrate lyase-like PEP mutase family enzyme